MGNGGAERRLPRLRFPLGRPLPACQPACLRAATAAGVTRGAGGGDRQPRGPRVRTAAEARAERAPPRPGGEELRRERLLCPSPPAAGLPPLGEVRGAPWRAPNWGPARAPSAPAAPRGRGRPLGAAGLGRGGRGPREQGARLGSAPSRACRAQPASLLLAVAARLSLARRLPGRLSAHLETGAPAASERSRPRCPARAGKRPVPGAVQDRSSPRRSSSEDVGAPRLLRRQRPA